MTRDWRRILALIIFPLGLVLLAARSFPPTIVGDGGEYLSMAQSFQQFAAPERFVHFWVYPLLAVPFLTPTTALTGEPLVAFTALNLVLLTTAWWRVTRQLNWSYALLIFAGPILWWTDKAHTEVFTFSLLAIAFAEFRERPAFAGVKPEQATAGKPWWSFVALGAAATQNPPIAAALLLFGAARLVTRPAAWRDRRAVMGAAAGLGLAALHPLYYLITERRLSPLAPWDGFRWPPSFTELTAVLWDPNIGLLTRAPLLVLGWLVVLTAILLKRPRALLTRELALAVVTAALFLIAFTQTDNFNHGATPSMSRYALWLMPLSLPLVQIAQLSLTRRFEAWFLVVVLASAIASYNQFYPARRQDHLRETRLAHVLWTHHPAFMNPVPEIFSERLHQKEDAVAPIATARCEKVLTIGRGASARGEGTWPSACTPVSPPSICQVPQVLCYANQRSPQSSREAKVEYDFLRLPYRPANLVVRYDATRAWPQEVAPKVTSWLERLKWTELNLFNAHRVRSADGVRAVYELDSDDRIFVLMLEVDDGSAISLRIPTGFTGKFFDGETTEMLGDVRYDGAGHEMWRLQVPAPRKSVVLVMGER